VSLTPVRVQEFLIDTVFSDSLIIRITLSHIRVFCGDYL